MNTVDQRICKHIWGMCMYRKVEEINCHILCGLCLWFVIWLLDLCTTTNEGWNELLARATDGFSNCSRLIRCWCDESSTPESLSMSRLLWWLLVFSLIILASKPNSFFLFSFLFQVQHVFKLYVIFICILRLLTPAYSLLRNIPQKCNFLLGIS